MYKILIASLALALSLSVSAGTLTQTQVTGHSTSSGVYQSQANGVRIVNKSSFGFDAQTYQNDCGSSCNTDNKATFSFAESVNTVVFSAASASGTESSSTSFCSTAIATDHLSAGNSSSSTNNARSGIESNASLTLVSGARVEVEDTSNGGAEYGEAITVSSWSDVKRNSYSGVTASASIITSKSSFMY